MATDAMRANPGKGAAASARLENGQPHLFFRARSRPSWLSADIGMLRRDHVVRASALERASVVLALALIFMFAASAAPVKAQGFGGTANTMSVQVTEPLRVAVTINIDQITNIDQVAENFTAVGTIRLGWFDPVFAFDVDAFGRDYRAISADEFVRAAEARATVAPAFVLQNQQGNRWVQESFVVIQSNGTIEYYERFTSTFQAPYFKFRKFPFDTQEFFVEIISANPVDVLIFDADHERSGLGPLLGEEEWMFGPPELSLSIATGITGLESAKVALRLEGRRHLQYYIFRIFLPILTMIIITWGTFFLDEYRKRIDLASANLLVFVAFNFTISSQIPRLGYMTFMDWIIISMFVVTASIIILNVFLQQLDRVGKRDISDQLDKVIIPLGYFRFIAD